MEFDDGWGLALVIPWSGAPGYGAWSIAKPSTGAWHNLVVTYDYGATTNDPVIYLNGVSQTVTERQAPSGSPTNDASTLRLGANATPGEYHDGRFAEFAIWNRILSADGKGFSPKCLPRGMVLHSPFNRATEIDTIQGATITLANSPTLIDHPRIIYPTGPQIMRFAADAAAAVRYNIMNTVGM
jgi:hypothetical protein